MKRGFTLVEVMIALSLLGIGLVVLIQAASGSMAGAKRAQMIGVVTDLSRGKMHDIEEILLKDGFTDTNQSEGECPEKTANGEDKSGSYTKTFETEGWPSIKYAYKVEQVELPSFEDLQAMADGKAKAAGSGSGGSGAGSGENAFQNSALGGMLSQLGGGFGGGGSKDIDSRQGASFIQGQYQMVQQVLKVSIRKVTLCVAYELMGSEETMRPVAFYTDASAMDKVLSGLGSQDLDDQQGSGSGKGSGSGSGSGGPTRGGSGSPGGGPGGGTGGGGGTGSGKR
jgi:prepilin-type N-terminal cleavage/methylation domain-containing protein